LLNKKADRTMLLLPRPAGVAPDSSLRVHMTGAPNESALSIASVLALWCLVWVAAALLVHPVPPDDSIEQLVWAQGLEWGYYKHPPLPTWITWLTLHTFGGGLGMTAVLAYVVLAIGFAFFWLFVRDLAGRGVATTTVVLSLCVYHFGGRGYVLNHNTFSVALGYASAWAALRALRPLAGVDYGRWSVLGLIAGLSLLAKYQSLLTLAAIAAAAWQAERLWATRFRADVLRGLTLAALVAAAVVMPHVVWLIENGFAPLHYAEHSVLGHAMSLGDRAERIVHFVAMEVRDCGAALAAFGLIAWLRRRRRAKAVPSFQVLAISPSASTWAMVLAIGPFAFVASLCLLFGVFLHGHWVTTVFEFSALPVALWLHRGNRQTNSRLLIQGAILAQAMMLVWFVWIFSSQRGVMLGAHRSGGFEPSELEEVIEDVWEETSSTSVPYVVAPQWLGGLAAYALPERPQVVIDGDFQKTPWVDQGRVEQCGAVYLGSAARQAIGPDITRGVLRVPAERPEHATHALDFAIVPPRGECPPLRAPPGTLRAWIGTHLKNFRQSV